ncbi:MAG: hypothetical protein JXP34_11780 [Planctomycetes bacterium]|nr:hypothetical protein [Planctomycetota bacterium]
MRERRIVAGLCIVVLGAGLAWGTPGDIDRGVPDGAMVFAHWKHNAERDYLKPYIEEVWTAFRQSGLIEEVVRMATASMPPEGREAVAAQWKSWAEVLRKVDWEAFIADEFVMGLDARMIPGMPVPAMLPRFIMRVDPERLGANMDALNAVFVKLAGLQPQVMEAVVADEAGAKWVMLRVKEPPLPFGLYAAAQDGVFAFGLQKELVDESLRLIRGETQVGAAPGAKPLVETERFARAFAGLPESEDGRSFVDVRGLLTFYRQIVDVLGIQAAQDPRVGAFIPVVKKLVDHADVVDCAASVETTEGQRLHTYTATRMREGWEEGPVYKLVENRVLPEGYSRWIPASATSFSASAGINVLTLYRQLRSFVETDVPNGPKLLERWAEIQERIDFHPDKDLLSWIEGTVIRFGAPAAAPNPLGGSQDAIVILAVRDVDKARRKIDEWIGRLLELIPPDQAMVQVTDAPGLEGFKSISFVPMPFIRPTFGFWKEEGGPGGVLLLGTSDAGIKLALAAHEGESKDLREHPFVKEMGGLPTGIVTGVSYEDLARSFGELAQMCGMVTMAAAFIPDDQEGARIIKQVLSLVPRLSPVLYKMRFLQTSSKVTTYDPSTRTLKQHGIVRTAPPKKTDAEEPPEKKESEV